MNEIGTNYTFGEPNTWEQVVSYTGQPRVERYLYPQDGIDLVWIVSVRDVFMPIPEIGILDGFVRRNAMNEVVEFELNGITYASMRHGLLERDGLSENECKWKVAEMVCYLRRLGIDLDKAAH